MNVCSNEPFDCRSDHLQAVALSALAQYEGEFGDVQLIKHRENAVFAVTDKSGGRFALRIHRPGYHSLNSLRSELSWIRALSREGVPVPEVVLDRQGQPLVVATDDRRAPQLRHVSLLRWIDGPSLGAFEGGNAADRHFRVNLYWQLGVLMAQLHDHGSRWEIPRHFERHRWFADALVGDRPLWGTFWDVPFLSPTQRTLLNDARLAGLEALSGYPIAPNNSGLIHADLIPIDFDDAGFGWHMFDMATSLYFLTDDPEFSDLRDATIAGYRSARPLSDRDVAMLPLFLMLRGTTYLGWASSRSETETAREQTEALVMRCCAVSQDYLSRGHPPA
jgi:Ser/Thr protein kinase RdoA (MazF antagonist)